MDDAARQRAGGRIARDLSATAHRELVLEYRPGEGGWVDCRVVIDGVSVGTFGRHFPTDEEPFVASLADVLTEFTLDEEVWGGWPICPLHGGHPMTTGLSGEGIAIWICPSGVTVTPIGSLAYSA